MFTQEQVLLFWMAVILVSVLLMSYMMYRINVKLHAGYAYWCFVIPFYNLALICKMGGQKQIYAYLPIIVPIALRIFRPYDITPKGVMFMYVLIFAAQITSFFFISKAWGEIARKLDRDGKLYAVLFFSALMLMLAKDIGKVIDLPLMNYDTAEVGLLLLFSLMGILAFYKKKTAFGL